MAKSKTTKSRKRKIKTKHYTYMLVCSFKMQFTFTESEVEQDTEGGEGDLAPTDEALGALTKELEECLAERYPVTGVEVWADSDDLLGVEET